MQERRKFKMLILHAHFNCIPKFKDKLILKFVSEERLPTFLLLKFFEFN